MHAHKPKFGLVSFVCLLFFGKFLPFQISFLSLSFCFSQLIYFCYFLHVIFLLATIKSLVLIMAKPGNGTLTNYRYHYNGPFYYHLCPKTDNIVFKFAMSECPWYPKTTVVQIDLLQLCYLLIKNVWSHLNRWCHKWYKEHDHWVAIYGYFGIKELINGILTKPP